MGLTAWHDTRTEIVQHEVVKYKVLCDALHCGGVIFLTVDGDPEGDPGHVLEAWGTGVIDPNPDVSITCLDDAAAYAVGQCDWQEGTVGVQRGHMYCPDHWEEER